MHVLNLIWTRETKRSEFFPFKELSPNSFSAERSFSHYEVCGFFSHKEAKVMNGWCSSRVLTSFRKQVGSFFFYFVESVNVNFALLRFMGPIVVLCVDWAMTILSFPLLTYVTWVLLDVIYIIVINLLTKEMRGRKVPWGVLEICIHKILQKS